MSLRMTCPCGFQLPADHQPAGHQRCPQCGRAFDAQPPQEAAEVVFAAGSEPAPPAEEEFAEPVLEVSEFLDPPAAPSPQPAQVPAIGPMLMALLDPRSIRSMLGIGLTLTVLGLIVWLTSLGLFENKLVLAAALGAGTLAVLASGWFVQLRTRYKLAGQALTFLACVVAPLNLWFYHAQDLVTLDQHLWIAGVVCCLLYALTVYVLRDPLFLYAVEAGLTLTALLFLGELHLLGDTSYLCLTLLGLGLVSIHAERAFAPEAILFSRRRFGAPLYWSGHAQTGTALVILLGTQALGWLLNSGYDGLQVNWAGNWLTHSSLLAGGLWLVGGYLYLYSEIAVRRSTIAPCLAALSLVLAEVTLVGSKLPNEGLMAVLALTALVAVALQTLVVRTNEKLNRVMPALSLGLASVPVLMGGVLWLRGAGPWVDNLLSFHAVTKLFVPIMLWLAVSNNIAAWLYRQSAKRASVAYLGLGAIGLMLAATVGLQTLGREQWLDQAPLLMAIPLGYLVASRLCRGQPAERALEAVAHALMALVWFSGLSQLGQLGIVALHPAAHDLTTLMLGSVLLEAAVFYGLAGIWRSRGDLLSLATLALAAAAWQGFGYFAAPPAYFLLLSSGLGLGLLAISRLLGMNADVNSAGAQSSTAHAAAGLLQIANGVILLSLAATFCQGLMRFMSGGVDWPHLWSIVGTTAVTSAAILIAPRGDWRRIYASAAILLVGVSLLTLNRLSHLNAWQKLEVVSAIAGSLLIVASYIGRFREDRARPDDMVSVGLWLGSLLASGPILVAVICYRLGIGQVSLVNELALLTVSTSMLLTGLSWHVKSTSFVGGGTLGTYLVMLLITLGWQQQLAVGKYLAAGGGLIFALGIGLSVYRERLLAIPTRMANREGLFQILDWR